MKGLFCNWRLAQRQSFLLLIQLSVQCSVLFSDIQAVNVEVVIYKGSCHQSGLVLHGTLHVELFFDFQYESTQ